MFRASGEVHAGSSTFDAPFASLGNDAIYFFTCPIAQT